MIISREKLSEICIDLRAKNKIIVFTNGCFDVIHRGHVEYLEQARNIGDVLIVGLNSDESVRRLKGNNRPINSEEDRSVVLSSLRSVDYVTIFDEDTPYELIKLLQPGILVKGGDYQLNEIVGADIVLTKGGKVVAVPLIEGKSTSELIKRILKEST